MQVSRTCFTYMMFLVQKNPHFRFWMEPSRCVSRKWCELHQKCCKPASFKKIQETWCTPQTLYFRKVRIILDHPFRDSPLDLRAKNPRSPLQVLVGEEPKEMLDWKRSVQKKQDRRSKPPMNDGRMVKKIVPGRFLRAQKCPWKFDKVRGTVQYFNLPRNGFKSAIQS